MLGLNKMPSGPYLQMIYGCRPHGDGRAIQLLPQEHDDARWVTIAEMRSITMMIPYLEMILQRGMLNYLDALATRS